MIVIVIIVARAVGFCCFRTNIGFVNIYVVGLGCFTIDLQFGSICFIKLCCYTIDFRFAHFLIYRFWDIRKLHLFKAKLLVHGKEQFLSFLLNNEPHFFTLGTLT